MPNFTFHFSLSTLDHLGRGLYRSLATVIAEAISNAWDADATEVRVELDESNRRLTIWDNGVGMDAHDFQDKFLKIGYRKRKEMSTTAKGRKILGRKGIGKLAYLSISEDIIVHTRKGNGELISTKISNTGINEHIDQESDSDNGQYELEDPDGDSDVRIKESGTQLVFDDLFSRLVKKNIRQSLATHFHFANALQEGDKFSIVMDNKPIGIGDLEGLYEKIQFIWFVDRKSEQDFYDNADEAGISTKNIQSKWLFDEKFVNQFVGARGFIASVTKPSDLVITGSKRDFRASIALFAGGRMRQANLLSDMPSAQIPESYLFGQIHVDKMDEGDIDRFTSARDSVMENDELYDELATALRKEVKTIMSAWDGLRLASGHQGDPDNVKNITPFERKTQDMINLWAKANKLADYTHPASQKAVNTLKAVARENLGSYVECFIAENMVRFLVADLSIEPTPEMRNQIEGFQKVEEEGKKKANITFDITCSLVGDNSEVNYVDLPVMANVIDAIEEAADSEDKTKSLMADVDDQKPIRNALMHSRRLTISAQQKGQVAWVNIVRKVLTLLEKRQN